MKQRTAKKLQRNFLRVKLGYSNPWLKKLIEATCDASEYIKIDGVRFQAPNNA